ncbi:MAG TPA: hypothetical protein VNJ08_11625 [Bacteriovoracaceae bacterium]|nr:hypothetical protein [Bacteriovoracaceae bacterium]
MKSKSRAILEKKGFTQNFVAGLSSFTSPGWILIKTDLLLTCPRKLAMSYQQYLPLKIQETPFGLGKLSMVQVWHSKHHADPAHIWLRNAIQKICNFD